MSRAAQGGSMWWHGANYTTTKQAVAVAANKSVGVAVDYDHLVGHKWLPSKRMCKRRSGGSVLRQASTALALHRTRTCSEAMLLRVHIQANETSAELLVVWQTSHSWSAVGHSTSSGLNAYRWSRCRQGPGPRTWPAWHRHPPHAAT